MHIVTSQVFLLRNHGYVPNLSIQKKNMGLHAKQIMETGDVPQQQHLQDSALPCIVCIA